MLVSIGLGIALVAYIVGLIQLVSHPTVGHVELDYYEVKHSRLMASLPLL